MDDLQILIDGICQTLSPADWCLWASHFLDTAELDTATRLELIAGRAERMRVIQYPGLLGTVVTETMH